MPEVLEIVLLDDDPADAALVCAVLEQAGILCRVTRAANREQLVEALRESVDLAILDYVVPDCGGLQSLELCLEHDPELPCVMLSGILGEERAVECLRAGAKDFVLKSKLGALPEAVTRAIRAARERQRIKGMEERLQEAHRLEAIGELTGSIAHDFNNQLSAVLGFTELALLDLDVEHPAYDHMTKVEFAARSCAELTKRLLAFGRRQILRPQVVEFNEFVHEQERLLRGALPSQIALSLDLGRGVECVRIDLDSMRRVLTNLAVNARDAMPRGGTLTLRTRAFDHDPSQPHPLGDLVPELPAGPWAVLSVQDSGAGMTAEVQSRIFEPFFSTKHGPEGNGLGMAMVHGTVLQSGGHVGVESELGAGSTISVFLPRVGPATLLNPALTPIPPARPRYRQPTETVLVVDDEELVRQFNTLALEQAGYTVLPADDGEHALQVAAAHAGEIHAALIDLVMPNLGGVEAARRLQAARPDLKLVYTSGYSKQAATEDEGLPVGADFLQKPASIARLLAAVRGALDRDLADD
ncbi:MAG: response regulator [Planctomycetota bacterium]